MSDPVSAFLAGPSVAPEKEKIELGEPTSVDEFLQGVPKPAPNTRRREIDIVKKALPQKLRVFNPATLWDDEAEDFETPIELSEDASAFLVGAGHMMSDTYRGIQQMVTEDEKQLAMMQAEEKIMNDLYNDPRFKNSAMTGAIFGALTAEWE